MTFPTPDRPNPGTRSKADLARMTQIFGRLTSEEPELAKVVTNEVGMRLALLPAGTFYMGAGPDEAGARENEGPRHPVVLSADFYIGVGPVTQAEYRQVTGTNPSHFTPAAGGGPAHPIEQVSWDDAAAFCRALSGLAAERQAGRRYRLPTEAEWEYACRAGEGAAYAFGPGLTPAQANFGGGYGPDGLPRSPALGRTSPVGAYPANNFGLADTHGNVWEWCADWYAEGYYDGAPLRDPGGPPAGDYRTLRGGCWRSHASSCRAAYRNASVPNNRDPYTGFRVVMVPA